MIRKQMIFQIQTYFSGSSFAMPLIVLAVFFNFMYSIKPLDVVSAYLLSSVLCFLMMVWIAASIVQGENPVIEQLLYLKMGNPVKYYLGKSLFLVFLTFILDLLYSFIPVLLNMVNGFELFRRPLMASDVGNAFLIMAGCGLGGAALGSLLHPRIIKDSRLAVMITTLLAILPVAGDGIVRDYPLFKYVFWILPPVMKPQICFGNTQYFQPDISISIFLILFVYAVIYSLIKSILCYKNKF